MQAATFATCFLVRYSKSLIQQEQEILNVARYQEERAFVVECLGQLHAAATPRDYYELHRRLLGRFIAVQEFRDGELRLAKLASRSQIASAKQAAPPDIDVIRRNQSVITEVGRQDRAMAGLLHVYRVLADGIAWRVLNYDR